MNTTYNPKADAEQARIYRDAVTPRPAFGMVDVRPASAIA